MSGLEPDSWKHIMIVLMLEILFLSFSLIFVGHGLKEWKKRREVQYVFTATTGIAMACLSLYATVLLLEL